MLFNRYFRTLALSAITSLLFLLCSSALAATLPSGFSETQVASGLTTPTAMEVAPDGRVFVCQQIGKLRVIKNGSLLATPFVTLTVDSNGERGLLGITFDPNFATNQFLYVYYTVPGDPAHNRVSRFTANGDVALAGSEFVLIDLDNLSGAGNHNGGAIHFGSDGKLYIAVGENANAANAQTLNNRLGKMLRINADGSIPTDNPFFNTAVGANRSIWAMGLRNPFTFAFQPGSGRMFINDVGETTWEEINDGVPGSNYGWSLCEGLCSPPNINFRDPLFQYGHGSTSTTGCAIVGGGFYNPTTTQFPASYVGKYFFGDLCSGWIRLYDPANGTASDFASGINQPVDIKVANDGSLYYIGYAAAALFRVQFTGNPTITTPPSDVTVAQGQPATFGVTASGSATLTYQWQRNQVNISGATSSSYTIAAAAFADNGAKFRCVVTNGFGSATSSEATLTVNAPPNITAPPANMTVTQGQPATFGVTASGSATLTYQWQRNQVNISGATSSSYTIAAAAFADNGAKFRCVVTNSFGSATSSEATLTVNAPPTITAPPADQTVTQGQPATFGVTASGSATLTYQWQRNQVNISGATSSSYTIAAAAFADNGAKFRCVVTNSFGSATSSEATLTVNAPPTITAQPADQTVTQGQPATFGVTASGSATLTYQWQRNQVNISGATSSSYTIAAAAFADNGAKFRCVVTNGFGSATSSEATLTVNAPPTITAQPADQTATQGQTATFGVTASGSPTLAYQWQRNQVNISGATSATYTTAATTASDNGAKFRCVVTNAFGNATSNEVTLTVQPPPPALATEDSSDSAIALDSVTLFRDPFPLTNPFNFSSDSRTRVMLFASNLTLGAGENASSVTARAEDAQFNVYPLTVEFVGAVPGQNSFTEVVIILPSNLPTGQSVLVSLTWHSQTTNKARIRIK
jgi:glucose/arabinose dehydrogenase